MTLLVAPARAVFSRQLALPFGPLGLPTTGGGSAARNDAVAQGGVVRTPRSRFGRAAGVAPPVASAEGATVEV